MVWMKTTAVTKWKRGRISHLFVRNSHGKVWCSFNDDIGFNVLEVTMQKENLVILFWKSGTSWDGYWSASNVYDIKRWSFQSFLQTSSPIIQSQLYSGKNESCKSFKSLCHWEEQIDRRHNQWQSPQDIWKDSMGPGVSNYPARLSRSLFFKTQKRELSLLELKQKKENRGIGEKLRRLEPNWPYIQPLVTRSTKKIQSNAQLKGWDTRLYNLRLLSNLVIILANFLEHMYGCCLF